MRGVVVSYPSNESPLYQERPNCRRIQHTGEGSDNQLPEAFVRESPIIQLEFLQKSLFLLFLLMFVGRNTGFSFCLIRFMQVDFTAASGGANASPVGLELPVSHKCMLGAKENDQKKHKSEEASDKFELDAPAVLN